MQRVPCGCRPCHKPGQRLWAAGHALDPAHPREGILRVELCMGSCHRQLCWRRCGRAPLQSYRFHLHPGRSALTLTMGPQGCVLSTFCFPPTLPRRFLDLHAHSLLCTIMAASVRWVGCCLSGSSMQQGELFSICLGGREYLWEEECRTLFAYVGLRFYWNCELAGVMNCQAFLKVLRCSVCFVSIGPFHVPGQ